MKRTLSIYLSTLLLLGLPQIHSADDKNNDPLKKELESLLEVAKNKSTNQASNGSPSIPNITISGDFLGRFHLAGDQPIEIDNNIDLRELEFGFYGDVDHWASALVLFALHREPPGEPEAGKYHFDIHEAYLNFTDIGWNLSTRLGFMFLDFGRLNRIHRHDWDFGIAPEIHQVITNDRAAKEGVKDIGVEVSWLAPLPFFQEWKVGVFRGRTFGHTHSDGINKPNPLYLVRNKQFFNLSQFWSTQLGFSFIRYNPDQIPSNVNYTYGSDIIFRFLHGRKLTINFATEIWQRRKTTLFFKKDFIVNGAYTYLMIKPGRWHFGYRFDVAESNDPRGNIKENYFGNSLWLGFSPSEFSRFRFTLENRFPKNYGGKNKSAWIGFFQTTFILGAHPAHRY